MLHKVIGLLLTAVVCTATTTTSLSSSLSNNNKSTFEIHRTLQNNQQSLLNNGHHQTSRQLTSSSSSYTTLPSSYSSSSKSSKGSRYYYSSKSSKKRSRRRRHKKYYSTSYDKSKDVSYYPRDYSKDKSKDDGMIYGGGGGGGKLYSTSSTLTTSSGSSSSEDHYYNKGFIYGSKSSKKRGKSSKSTSFSHSSSSSSFDHCLVGNTIAEVIREENGLDILETALDVAMLDGTLSRRGPFTLFAPNREAFEALPDEALAALLEEDGREDLVSILALHVVHGEIRAEDLSNNQVLETLNGEELTVSINEGVVVLIGSTNNVTVVATDIDACNGVVHVIDGVLLPSFEETSISSSSVDVTSSKTTHFTSASFSKSSKRGRLRSFGTSKSGKSSKSGSFTHFTGPSSSSSSFDDPCLEDDAVTIVDVAEDIVIDGTNVLSTLATALDVAGLDDTLDNHGPFTLFAPSQEAFDDLPDGTLDSLLEDPEALGDVLGLHVVHGEVLADDLVDGQHLRTLNGDYIEVTIDDEGNTIVGGAPLLQVSFDPCNGVVYIIDAVILSSVSKPTTTSSSGDMFHRIGSKSRKSGKSGFAGHGFSSFSASGSFSKSSKGFLHRQLEEDAHRRLTSASGSKSSKRGKSKSSKRRGSDKRDRQQRQRARAKRKHEIAMGLRDDVTGELIQAQMDTPAPNNNREATLSPTITFTRPPMTGVRTASPTVLTTRAPDTPQPTENTVVTPDTPTNGDENEDMFPTFAPAPFFIDPETPVPPPGSPITPFPTEPDSPNNMPPTPPTPSGGGSVMPPSSGGKPYGDGYYDSVQSRDSYGSKDGSWYWSSSSSSKSSKKSKGSKGSSGSSWSSSSSGDGGSWKWKSHSSSSKDTWESSPDWKPGWGSWGMGNAQKRAEKRKEKQEKREEMNRNRAGGNK